LLASVKAFSAFFALVSADLVDFSALTLAAVAASKAFLEALSSASKDEIRALAVAKASIIRKKGGRVSRIKKHIKELEISRVQTRRLPSEALAVFKYSAHSVPKAMNFFISTCQGKNHMSIRITQET
jgi:hypothetical protein